MDTHIARSARRIGDTPPTGWRRDTHRTGTLSELLSLLLAGDAVSAHSDAQPVLLHQVLSGETLFHQGAQAQTLAFVSVGSFKLFTTAEDGYQQVIDFAERADVLGFDALDAGRHPTRCMRWKIPGSIPWPCQTCWPGATWCRHSTGLCTARRAGNSPSAANSPT